MPLGLERVLASCHTWNRRAGWASQGNLGGTVCAHKQDAAACQASSEVEKQVERAAIGPLQVVHHQEEGGVATQRAQHIRILLKQGNLLRDGWARGLCPAGHERFESGQPGFLTGPGLHGSSTRQKRRARHKEINKVWTALYDSFYGHRQQIPQPAGLLAGHGPGCPWGFHVASQELDHLAERQVGVADAGVGVAVPPCNH